MIAVEGIIGAGKSTVAQILSEETGIPVYNELEDPYTEDLLDRFYADKRRWAFTLQIHFLNHRFRMIKDIFENNGGILDRSIYGDKIFAELQHENDDMSSAEYHTYRQLLDNMLEHAYRPHLMVFLDSSVEEAMRRIRQRGREYEQSIPEWYMEQLHRKYIEWYYDYDLSPKIMLNTEVIDPETEWGRTTIVNAVTQTLHQPWAGLFQKEEVDARG